MRVTDNDTTSVTLHPTKDILHHAMFDSHAFGLCASHSCSICASRNNLLCAQQQFEIAHHNILDFGHQLRKQLDPEHQDGFWFTHHKDNAHDKRCWRCTPTQMSRSTSQSSNLAVCQSGISLIPPHNASASANACICVPPRNAADNGIPFAQPARANHYKTTNTRTRKRTPSTMQISTNEFAQMMFWLACHS